ncbi:uncharacterized protein EDB91DRAFT_1103479 [Suillus paluster]|uniref:uncharacterized protein n=1 Tax=Suillus paluster TaxID=48578 RepID=UPI001B85F6CE|nr:uncharacterized protein EDB91DRAFT_1103479 [Suillus paluster]KAG1752610.1 hypothetical protein EDB91DRAFT_1103479 [Suillus paluster]
MAHRGGCACLRTTIPRISLFISGRMTTTDTMDLVADDDIDTETLQAKINMSMSFAEDLVSSWIKPAHKANLSKSAVDAQKLLDEQLRRPPRLGVGAPIPESSVTARDAARLKHRLMGKGKKRATEDDNTPKPEHSEDEERRGGTIRKKPKLDPFVGRSKAKAKIVVNPATQLTHNPNRQAHCGDSKTGDDNLEQGREGHSMSSSLGATQINTDLSAKKREKKRRRHATGMEASMSFQELAIPHYQPIITSPDRSGNQSLPVNPPPLGSESSSVSFSISGPFSMSTLQTELKRDGELNVPDTSTQLTAPPTEASRLTVPLLNLDGPPERGDGSGKDDNPDSPKKKRKRRKKKKHPFQI